MKKIIVAVVMLAFLSVFPGCSSPGITPIELSNALNKNKTELNSLWEIQMDAQQSDYAIDGDKLYILTWNQSIYIVDINTGEVIKNFKLNIEEIGEYEGDYSDGNSAYNGIVAINYTQKLVVVDTNTEAVLLNHKVVNGWAVAIDYDIVVYQDLLIYSHILENRIYAINYRTKEVQWQYGGDPVIHGKFTLLKYQDKYLYRKSTELAYFEFEPLTGNVKQKYQVESAGEIKNEKQSYFIPVFIIL